MRPQSRVLQGPGPGGPKQRLLGRMEPRWTPNSPPVTPGCLCLQDSPPFMGTEGETTNCFAPPKRLLCTLAGLISFYG